MSFQKFFLFALFVAIGLYSFYFFQEKKIFSDFSLSEPIHIEPIVIPDSVKEDSNSEILEKLKLATKEVFKNAQPSEDEIAQEVLVTLKALLIKNREDKRKKQKELLIEKEHKKREELKKKALARKKRLKKDRMLVKKRAESKKKECARKKRLEDESKIENFQEYEISEEKDDNFDDLPFVETLGVISVSKPFTKN